MVGIRCIFVILGGKQNVCCLFPGTFSDDRSVNVNGTFKRAQETEIKSRAKIPQFQFLSLPSACPKLFAADSQADTIRLYGQLPGPSESLPQSIVGACQHGAAHRDAIV